MGETYGDYFINKTEDGKLYVFANRNTAKRPQQKEELIFLAHTRMKSKNIDMSGILRDRYKNPYFIVNNKISMALQVLDRINKVDITKK